MFHNGRLFGSLAAGCALIACQPSQARLASAPPPTDEEMAEFPADGETSDTSVEEEPSALAPTRVLSTNDVARLATLQGITLQWIGWEKRGDIEVRTDDNGIWWLEGEQRGEGEARVTVNGHITEIGDDYFLLDGQITIVGAPDADRTCDANKLWRFAVTQNRRYYRLREFEWCDYLTDYIDIYF